MRNRRSGILLHITSLPSAFGIGDLGTSAYAFADFLAQAGQCLWQILPLNPTSREHGNSPYSSYSAFAENPLLISPEMLVRDGYLNRSEINDHPRFPADRVEYHRVLQYKEKVLTIVFEKNKDRILRDSEFEKFCDENAHWLDDYTLFVTLKHHFSDRIWNAWPEDIRKRRKSALRKWREKLRPQILNVAFSQFLFFKQWASFKDYCRSRNLQIVGDIPIYVHYDSADVWAHPQIFKLNRERQPTVVAGVPPDYFSATGQLWGNPVFNWETLRKKGYSWWIRRIEHNMNLFDIVRIDHFRGFVGYWEVKADAKSAVRGKWVEAPARDFFARLLRHFTSLPIIAEDLGVITPDVREVMSLFNFPGMKLLHFAFGEDNPNHPYLPHNFPENCLVYTGTHDNNTTVGWYRKEASAEEKRRVSDYLGRRVTERNVHWELIRLAMSSVARTVIIPMQDILGLGEDARMNLPSTSRNNWTWRLLSRKMTVSVAEKLLKLTEMYGRS